MSGIVQYRYMWLCTQDSGTCGLNFQYSAWHANVKEIGLECSTLIM
jgi:hypothetical protein